MNRRNAGALADHCAASIQSNILGDGPMYLLIGTLIALAIMYFMIVSPGFRACAINQAVFFAALLTISSSGGDLFAQDNRYYLGFPNSSCGTWSARRTEKTATHMEFWALGFLSGSNWASVGKDQLRGLDAAALEGWLDNYCREHPLKTLPHAVMALGRELGRRGN